MKVLLAHRYFWPENVATLSLMLRDLVHLHHDRGDTVRVVAGASDDFSAQHEAEFPEHFQSFTFRAGLDRDGGIPRRIAISFRLLVCCLRHVLFGKKWDLLYTLSYPPLLAWFLIAFGQWSGRARRSIYYLEDNHVYRMPPGPMRWLYRRVLKSILRRATCTITLSKDMADELVSYFPDAEQDRIARKIALVPNFSPDISHVQELPETLEHDIIYAGNHGFAQNLELFLQMLARPEVDPKPKVSFFGGGQAREMLIARASELGLDEVVTFNESVPRAEAQLQMASARFGLVGAIPDLLRFGNPSKLAGYNIVGTKGIVMCDEDGGTAAELAETGFGYPLDPVDAAKGARQLQAILSIPVNLADRRATQMQALEAYGSAAYLEKMARLLDNLEAGRDVTPAPGETKNERL